MNRCIDPRHTSAIHILKKDNDAMRELCVAIFYIFFLFLPIHTRHKFQYCMLQNVNNNAHSLQRKQQHDNAEQSRTCISLSSMKLTKCIVCNARDKRLDCFNNAKSIQRNSLIFYQISMENCPKVWTLEIFIKVTSVCHLCCST